MWYFFGAGTNDVCSQTTPGSPLPSIPNQACNAVGGIVCNTACNAIFDSSCGPAAPLCSGAVAVGCNIGCSVVVNTACSQIDNIFKTIPVPPLGDGGDGSNNNSPSTPCEPPGSDIAGGTSCTTQENPISIPQSCSLTQDIPGGTPCIPATNLEHLINQKILQSPLLPQPQPPQNNPPPQINTPHSQPPFADGTCPPGWALSNGLCYSPR